MLHEKNDFNCDDLAEICRNAQHRRAEDIGGWLSYFFEKRRQLRSIDAEPRYLQQDSHGAEMKTGRFV